MNRITYPNERLAAAVKACPLTQNNLEKRTALDIGCGDGRHVKLLAECGYQADGIDINLEVIENAKILEMDYKELISQVNFICADIMQYKPEKLYDAIIAWKYLYAYNKTYEECEERVKNINSLLKRGGYAFLHFATKEDEVYTTGKELYEKGSRMYKSERMGVDGYVFHDRVELIDMLTRCGFEIKRLENLVLRKTLEKPNGEGNGWWRNKEFESVMSRFIVSAEKI